jgi:hypothetical protein
VVDVQLAVDPGAPVHAVVDTARRRIASRLAEQTGPVDTDVDVDVRSPPPETDS